MNFINAVHPENKPYFRAIATPTKEIRAGRSNMSISCSQCTTASERANLQRCGKCKSAWYCSKDCQKKHWPFHKIGCKETSADIPKMMQNFFSNALLNHVLQIALALAFKLHEKPIIGTPFIARCTVNVQPADVMYYMQTIMGRFTDEEVKKGMEGMLQILTLVPLDPHKDMDYARMELWKLSSRTAAERGNVGVPVGIVDMQMKGEVHSQSFGIAITDDAVKRARSGTGFEMESALLPGRKQVPMSEQACIDFINMHIRSDKKNQLRLRTHLSKEDIDKMRGASESGEKNNEGVS
ncbi:hypothetical protein HYPSUDRAFT_39638 [Hypholoma sublateritium FD-334 SS-4]|uniref:MYND-type domain-containing protein n=1 Tax=Hypholoma sublateritium (strain FD-334 SS-4) TaxID=945553 RepID=A0A0D2P581_HYPSF|nr:hypothetical protein HYPSUDRAFT_39638 [Hypholoma sublateritium FD-334 SS-4]